MSQGAQTTYAISRVLSALGVKGGALPTMGIGEYAPVMVMGDFSRTLASEPIEARGFAAGIVGFIVGNRPHLEFQCVAGGGAVFEMMIFDNTTAVGQNVLLIQTGPSPFIVAGAPVPKTDIGGRPTRSILRADTFVSFPTGNEMTIQNPPQVLIDLSPLRWYVPPGWFLEFSNLNVDDMKYTVAWRELEEPIGAP